MKICLACAEKFSLRHASCPACGWGPDLQGQFPRYAPDLAREASGFKASYFEELADLEAGNFWFRSRNRLILWALAKYCPDFQSFLEIGCGTGFVLSGIAERYPNARLHGSELFDEGLKFAASRQPRVGFMQIDARRIPFAEEFDAIGAFDVIEHIEEDCAVLEQACQALRPGGVLLLTVPQHAWLWSPIDDYACHVRRYSSRELHEKVEAAGFAILRSTSFVSALLPAMWLSRLRQKTSPEKMDAAAELRISPWLNRMLEMVLMSEVQLIRMGMNFPAGGSRLLIAKKK